LVSAGIVEVVCGTKWAQPLLPVRCRYKEIMDKAPEEFKEYASCLDNYG
jgi:hypothetical protein